MEDRKHFFYLNLGHFLDHFFLLIFSTAAALALIHDWEMSYGQLIPYSTAGFIAFGLFSLPSGWLADRWSREGMICIFFIGIGIASVGASSAQSPLGIAVWLFILGVFASIYHPVGLALIAKGGQKMGRDIAVNGVWGNMGVGFAAFMTGLMIDYVGWRAAFWLPGLISIGIGILYFMDFRENILMKLKSGNASVTSETSFIGNNDRQLRRLMIRVSVIIFFTTAVSAIIFQSTTFALPKVFDERLGIISDSASAIGFMALFVFAVASFAQLVVGQMLDRIGPKRVFLAVSSLQLVFFIMFADQFGWTALLVATLFMLGAFGQIPINDYMIGKMAKSEFRASIYGVRFVVSFAVWAVVVPLISLVHEDYGFDILFYILAACALAIFVAASMLPKNLPSPFPA